MQSVNHQFPDLEDKIYTRYKKATVSALSGVRGDPYKGGYHRLEYVLQSKFDNFNTETGELKFSYPDDVIEMYSEDEDKLFRRLNARALTSGMLVPFAGERDAISTDNALSDDEVSDIAASKNLLNFKKRIAAIDSKVTLKRILDTVKRADRPYSFIGALETRINEL